MGQLYSVESAKSLLCYVRSWQMNGVQFLAPAPMLRYAVIAFGRPANDKGTIEAFLQELQKQARGLGEALHDDL